MALKIALFIACVLAIYQVNAYTISKREVQTPATGNSIDEFITNFKSGIDDLISKVQNNEDLQKLSAQMKQLGQEMADNAKKFAADAQKTLTLDKKTE